MTRSVSPRHATGNVPSRTKGSRPVKLLMAAKKVTAYVILDKEKNHVGTVQCVHNYDSGMMIVDVFYKGEFVFQGKSEIRDYKIALADSLHHFTFDNVTLFSYKQSGYERPGLERLETLGYTVIQAI